MEVKPGSNEQATTPFNPLAGWEAASRWNASAFDMMAKAWQQWLALVTTMPPALVSAQPQRSSPRAARSGASRPGSPEAVHAVAQAEPKRAPRSRRKPAPKRTRG